jgi:hypothetical protein
MTVCNCCGVERKSPEAFLNIPSPEADAGDAIARDALGHIDDRQGRRRMLNRRRNNEDCSS